MKNATNELQILVLVLDAAHMVSRGAQWWPFRYLCVVFVFVFVFVFIIIMLYFQSCGSLTNPMFAGQTELFAI